jgi:5-methylcytosine-specific restriction endonuclease McrA
MARSNAHEFFPLLRRRKSYSKRRDGKNYRYGHYRPEIAKDCLNRCGYCDCHESEIGGASNMDLDHFRPKGLRRFEHLTDEPLNLIYTCKSCNGLKSDWWPAKGKAATHNGREGFLDPFAVNRHDYFAFFRDGAIRGKMAPAYYMIGLLALDRPLLRRLREQRVLKSELAVLVAPLKQMAEELIAGKAGVDVSKMSRLTLEMTDRLERLLR